MRSLSDAARVRQSERTASRVVDGQAVVIVIDQHKLHTLNSVGTRIWQLASDQGAELSAIVAAIESEFEVDAATAREDAVQFIDQLCSIGALEVEAP